MRLVSGEPHGRASGTHRDPVSGGHKWQWVKWAAVNMCAQVFGFIRKSGIAGSCDDSKFDILRNCQTVFQNGSTISPFPPVLVEG